MKHILEKETSHKYFIGIFALAVFLIYWLFSTQYTGPAYLSDEIGYLLKASTLAGYPVDMASSWHGGYSILLSPLFVLFSDPYSIWQAIMVLNAAIFAVTFILFFRFLKNTYPDRKFLEIFYVVAICSFYPAWITMSGYAFSTPAFVLIFMLAVLSLQKVNPGKKWTVIPHSLLAGFLYWVHPTGLAVVASSFLIISALAFSRRKARILFVNALILILMVLAYRLVVHEWFNLVMTPEGYAARSHYQSMSMVFEQFGKISFYKTWFLLTLGHFSYALVASFGIVWFAFIETGRRLKSVQEDIGKEERHLAGLSLIFITISFTGILLLGSLNFATIAHLAHLERDSWIYGRYLEVSLLPLLGVGLMSFGKIRHVWSVLILVIIFGILINFVTLNPRSNLVNMPSFWPQALFPGKSIMIWIFLGASGIVFTALLKKKFLPVFILPLFIVCIFNQWEWHKNILSNYSNPSGLVSIVRNSFDSGTIAAFESFMPEGTNLYQRERFNLYSYYLYDYNYRRMSPDKWLENSDGPYLTYHPEVPAEADNVAVIARERSSGLFLVVKKAHKDSINMDKISLDDLYVNLSGDNSAVIQGCYSMDADTLSKYSNVGYLEDGKLITNGEKGYLFYGPYLPLKKGSYNIRIEGEFSDTSGAVIDIASGAGTMRHADYRLEDHEGAEPGNIILPLELKTDVKDIEIRLFVDKTTDLKFSSYTVELVE